MKLDLLPIRRPRLRSAAGGSPGSALVEDNDFAPGGRDPNVHILDLWQDFTNAEGTLKTALYSDGHLHLGPAGYEVFASKLKPVVEKLVGATTR